jgi:hypothetical protein
MTAEIVLAGASYHAPVDWHAIDWQKAHRNVRRLQVRMVNRVLHRAFERLERPEIERLTGSFLGGRGPAMALGYPAPYL